MYTNNKYLRIKIIQDTLLIILSFFLTFPLRNLILNNNIERVIYFKPEFLWVLALSIPLHQILTLTYKIKNRNYVFAQNFIQILIEVFILTFFIFLFKQKEFSRLFLLIFIFLKLLLITIFGMMIKAIYKKVNRLEKVLIVYTEKFDINSLNEFNNIKLEKLSNKEIAKSNLKLETYDQVIIYTCLTDLNKFKNFIESCQEKGKRISINIEEFNKNYLISVTKKNLKFFIDLNYYEDTPSYQLFKVSLDYFAGTLGSLLFVVLYILFYIPIKIQTKKSIIFKQIRVGKNGKEFYMYKFRSMNASNEPLKNEIEGPAFKMQNDPRITSFGKFLRKSSLDEFPQFLNIMKGDMSLVGPRPPIPSEVDKYEANFYKRMTVKPGITGFWQVYKRSHTRSFKDILESDIKYIENRSITLDIIIILKTLSAVIKLEGK